MTQQLRIALICAPLAIFFIGCSGSGSSQMLAPAGQPTEADVTSVMRDVVLPLIGGTADLDDSSSLAAPPPGEAETCTDLSDNWCQNGGTAERCSENNHVAWLYDQCERPSGLVHGTVTRDGGFFGTMNFDIAIGDLALDGSVEWDFDGCFVRSYDRFSAVSPDHSVLIDGSVRCLLTDPSGEIHMDVVSSDASFSLDLDFDNGVGRAEVHSSEGTFLCEIHMSSGEADCNEI